MPLSAKQTENFDSTISDNTNGEPTTFENPKWLTADLFETLLKEIIPNYRQIKHFKAKPALKAGENFCTVIVRVNIDVELRDGASKSLSYIMKIPRSSGFFRQMMTQNNIIKVEHKMYHEVVQEFAKLYRDASQEVNFSANAYDIETPSEFGVVLLEDLRPHGYKNANRLEGLDLAHTEAVLERLAQWHAASAVRVANRGLYPHLLNRGMFHRSQKETMSNFDHTVVPAFLSALKTLEGHEKYYDEVAKKMKNLLEEMFRAAEYIADEFNVLNHGDCWANNIMFKYDSKGKLEDALLIDYQLVNYGSPVKDLYYFLLSSTKYDLKVNSFDYFIKFYHDNLVKNLKLLNYPKNIPTLKDIHIAAIKHSIWGICTSFGILPLTLLGGQSSGAASVEGYFDPTEAGDSHRRTIFLNPRYCKHLAIIMPWLSNRGAFSE